jgi:hypothetical protein
MARNLDDDLVGWYGHIQRNRLEEIPSPLGDFGRTYACVSI